MLLLLVRKYVKVGSRSVSPPPPPSSPSPFPPPVTREDVGRDLAAGSIARRIGCDREYDLRSANILHFAPPLIRVGAGKIAGAAGKTGAAAIPRLQIARRQSEVLRRTPEECRLVGRANWGLDGS
jgi:hypothetical protein